MINMTSIGYRQQGMSFLGWMVVVAIFGLLTISFFKIFPIYSENFTIQSVLNSVKEDQKIDPKSKRAIWTGIIKRLSVNHILSIKRENVKIERKNGKTTVTNTYETRHTYIGNLFIGVNFSESVVIDL